MSSLGRPSKATGLGMMLALALLPPLLWKPQVSRITAPVIRPPTPSCTRVPRCGIQRGIRNLELQMALVGSVPRAHSTAARTVSIVSHGIQLSLIVPRTAIPANGLMRATIVLKNTSSRTVQLCTFCARPLGVEVLTPTGAVVYPPAVPLPFPQRGPGPLSVRQAPRIRPGGVVTARLYVIVRSIRIRAVAAIELTREIRVATPPLTLQLIPSPVTTVRSARLTVGRIVAVQLQPTRRPTGRLIYTDAYRCRAVTGQRGSIAGWTDWTAVASTTIVPPLSAGCHRVVMLHLIAGWLNQPVVQLDYSQP
jgi:hypothetical protein